MIVAFDPSVTGQQRQWINDTIARCKYPLENITDTVTFIVVAEPSAPGHKDMMCTSGVVGDGFTIEIRDGLDDPAGRIALSLPTPATDIKTLFQESVMHELGHVISFTFITTDEKKTEVAGWFARDGATGEGSPSGTLDDWESVDIPWEDRIVEAVAETIKDASLDDSHRLYDNRTNWRLT